MLLSGITVPSAESSDKLFHADWIISCPAGINSLAHLCKGQVLPPLDPKGLSHSQVLTGVHSLFDFSETLFQWSHVLVN